MHTTASRRMLLGVATAAFLTGFVVRALLPAGHPSVQRLTAPSTSGASEADSLPGPTRTTNGAPAGFAHTQPGALAAAASFVTSGQLLIDQDPLAASDAIREMSSTATAERRASDAMRQLAAAREKLSHGSGPITYRQAAVSFRIDSYTPERARIAIWNVGVLSRADVAPPQAAWATSTLELVWERDDWHLDTETISPGPAPVLNDSTAPATSAGFTSALDGFTDFGSAR